MAGKTTERRAKKESRVSETEVLQSFTLPDSLPCSEVHFPVLLRKRRGARWSKIVEEEEARMKELEEFVEDKKEQIPQSLTFLKTENDYIQNEVFVYLLPAIEEALNKAKMWDAFCKPHCFFNGIDHIVQVLWNSNPRFPFRKEMNLHVFNMPWVREYLKEHPRPLYPKSWLWTEGFAATLIQKTVRQYFVQRDEEVQEMRDFWRKLEIEQENPDLDVNPYLAKSLAVAMDTHKKTL